MSTAISQRMAEGIKDEVARLLGRGRTTFECPLNAQERQALWHGMFHPDVLCAFDLLRRCKYPMETHETHVARFETDLEGETYIINFWNYEQGLDHPLLHWHGESYHTFNQVAKAFPQSREYWPEFVQWIQNTGRIEKEFFAAQETLAHLLNFCNTIGQLTRAVPELAQYLTREKRETLQGQKRASNMPFEWSTFDRSSIDVLQFSLAKAHLMPVKQNLPWGIIEGSHAVLRYK